MAEGGRRRSRAVNALVAAISLLVSLGLAELALRLFHYRPQISSPWLIPHASARLVDDDVLLVRPVFRDDSFYQPYRNLGNTRVLVALGDSFTEGVPVKPDDAYPAVLERLLRARGYDVRVLNAGQGDTGPDQELALFTKYILPAVHPDVVVWQLYPNDTYDNEIKPLFDISAGDTLVPLDARRNWLYRRQRFYGAIPLPPSVKSESYLVHLMLRTYERDLFSQAPRGGAGLAWARRKIALEVDRMNQLAAEHGFRVYYTLLAPEAHYRTDVPVDSSGSREVGEFSQLLPIVQRQPHCFDGTFDGAAQPIFSDGTRDASPFGTRHFNEAGYALLAQRAADRILDDRPGVVVPFGTPSARTSMISGWSHDETSEGQSFVWSDGPESTLQVALPSGIDYRMTIVCEPLAVPGARQSLHVELNGVAVGEIALSPGRQFYSITLPRSALRGPGNSLVFRYASTRRPHEIDPRSADMRSLAVAWYSLRIAPDW